MHSEVIEIQRDTAPVQSQTHHLLPIIDIGTLLQRRNMILEFVNGIMVKDVDYGIIPGTGQKPVLLKPGAEKLVSIFGLTPSIVAKEQDLDWTGERHGGEPFFYFAYTFSMSRDGRILGVGEGCCHSWETKYRYRWVPESEVPPHLNKTVLPKRDDSITEFRFAVDKAETTGPYGKPPEYWVRFKEAIENGTARLIRKTTKTGKVMEAWEIPAISYRIPNPDTADQVNTIMKMAEKRGYIQSVLMALGLSEFFTQDLEDLYIPDAAPTASMAEETAEGHCGAIPVSPANKPKPEAKAAPYEIPRKEPQPNPQPTAETIEHQTEQTSEIRRMKVSDLEQMKTDIFRHLDAIGVTELREKGVKLNAYLRAFLGLAGKGPMPRDLDYSTPMRLLLQAMPDKARLLADNPAGLGAEICNAEALALYDNALKAFMEKYSMPLAAVQEHLDAIGIGDADTPELAAYLLIAAYTKTARLMIKPGRSCAATLASIQAKIGPLWPLRDGIAAKIETALAATCSE